MSAEPQPASLTIPNGHPEIVTDVRITLPFERLCPVSGEPQPGSMIAIAYRAAPLLLELKVLRTYIASFSGENPYGVRDLEQAAQVIASHLADALGVPVRVTASYILSHGTLEVTAYGECPTQ